MGQIPFRRQPCVEPQQRTNRQHVQRVRNNTHEHDRYGGRSSCADHVEGEVHAEVDTRPGNLVTQKLPQEKYIHNQPSRLQAP